MNSYEDYKKEEVLTFKEDIEICSFKELKNAITCYLSSGGNKGVLWSNCDFTNDVAQVKCELFPNGLDDDDEGCLSLAFSLLLMVRELEHCCWSCVVSIVNKEGDTKFLQSMAYRKDVYWDDSSQENPGVTRTVPNIFYKRLIERSVLFDDDEEYLPEGTLTLRCEMEVNYRENIVTGALKWAFENEHFRNSHDADLGFCCGLNLNSSIYPSLSEKSPFFERMFHSGMRETRRKWMPIPDNINSFADMLYFIEKQNLSHVRSPSSLFNLYKMADKYLFTDLKIECRKLISHFLTANTTAAALGLAYRYDDEELKKLCFSYIRSLSLSEELIIRNELTNMKQDHIVAELSL